MSSNSFLLTITASFLVSSSLAFQAGGVRGPVPARLHHLPPSFQSSTTSADGNEIVVETLQDQQSKLQELCDGLEIATELSVGEDSDGIRGLYVDASSDDIAEGSPILTIPLSSCLRDDEPPSWFQRDAEEENSSDTYSAGSEWATRLAASLIDLRLLKPTSDQLSDWISMLPDATNLRASLPIHWPSDVLQSAKCQPLELAVDSAYFGRANAVMDLSEALKEVGESGINQYSDDKLTRLCHDALDIVQTRTCRVNLGDEEGHEVQLRLLAPVFDLLNHGPSANAGFALEADADGKSVLVVRAVRAIARGEEVFISYGDSSTTPAWKCLLSYGFVPNLDIADERNTVELVVDGARANVGADNVPFELAEAAAAALADAEGRVLKETDEIFTSEVARRIAKRAAEEASDVTSKEDGKISASSDENVAISISLAQALRISQRRVLESWSSSLLSFADANS